MAEARDRRDWRNILHPKFHYAKTLPTPNLDHHFVLNRVVNCGIRQGEVVVSYDGGGQIEEGGIMRPKKVGNIPQYALRIPALKRLAHLHFP